jgi:site-specific recombinase XerD
MLFRKGVSAPTVQALAGHAHLTTTQRYAHVARVDLKEAIAKLAG